MIYHYCRVSSKDQNLDRQTAALSDYKIADEVFCDKQSGKNFDRAEYQAMKEIVVAGDEVIVKELDRLGRDKDAVKRELEWFKAHGVTVRSLDIPTTLMEVGDGQSWITDMLNNIMIEVIGAFAEQERNKIKQRQREGIEAMPVVGGKRVSAKTGRGFGRTKLEIRDFEKILQKQKDGLMTVTECCERLGISRSTWSRRVRENVWQYD